MGITSALVLFAVIWSMTFLIILPIRVKTQGDLGEIVPGTHAGAPEVHNLGKKARVTTLISLVLWLVICAIILSEVITVQDLDWFGRGAPAAATNGTDG
jgi:predicted secreted protein